MKKILISIMSIMAVACGSNSENSETGSSEVTASCLVELIEENEIEKMISIAQIAEITGKTEADITIKDLKMGGAQYSTLAYKWDPDEERVMIWEVEAPAGDGTMQTIKQKGYFHNEVAVGEIKLIEDKAKGAEEYFRYTYGPKTKKEKEVIKESVDRSNKVNDQSAETIKSMVDKQSASEVEGVGNLAYWSTVNHGSKSSKMYNEAGEVETTAKLRILHGNTMFTVSADISNDINEDLALAKEVAKQIVTNCE